MRICGIGPRAARLDHEAAAEEDHTCMWSLLKLLVVYGTNPLISWPHAFSTSGMGLNFPYHLVMHEWPTWDSGINYELLVIFWNINGLDPIIPTMPSPNWRGPNGRSRLEGGYVILRASCPQHWWSWKENSLSHSQIIQISVEPPHREGCYFLWAEYPSLFSDC